MMGKFSHPELGCCNPVSVLSLWNGRKYLRAWQETNSHVDVCLFWWTWWQPWQVIGALLCVLLRNTSNAGLQYSDATRTHVSSSLEAMLLGTGLFCWLGKTVTTSSKSIGYKKQFAPFHRCSRLLGFSQLSKRNLAGMVDATSQGKWP